MYVYVTTNPTIYATFTAEQKTAEGVPMSHASMSF